MNGNFDVESARRGAARRGWRGEERCSSEELGEKQGTETPLGVLQERDESGREKPREAWIQLGFAEHGQIVEPREVFG